jgi:formylmethanofuran dehydrogenase subunit C
LSPMTFSLRAPPAQRLDLSPLTPQNLSRKTIAEIESIEVGTTRVRATVGDVFRIRDGDPDTILIEGGSTRFDRVGMGMTSGSIRVEGEVGVEAGRLMSGGQLTIRGDAGPFAGSGMKGGTLDIEGDAGERLGGPLSGETVGMAGGLLHVRGDAGPRAGDRLRRGCILIEGRAGAYAGSRMIAGTLAIGGEAGELPGYLMGRGTIMLGRGATLFSPTFGDCGEHDLVAARLLADYVVQASGKLARLFRRPLRRLAGDLAALGKGEILLPRAQ